MINNIGLIINFVGTVLIAYSFGVLDSKDFGAGGSTPDSKDKEREIAYFKNPKWFKIGLILMAVGFLVQLSFVQSLLAQIRFR